MKIKLQRIKKNKIVQLKEERIYLRGSQIIGNSKRKINREKTKK